MTVYFSCDITTAKEIVIEKTPHHPKIWFDTICDGWLVGCFQWKMICIVCNVNAYMWSQIKVGMRLLCSKN